MRRGNIAGQGVLASLRLNRVLQWKLKMMTELNSAPSGGPGREALSCPLHLLPSALSSLPQTQHALASLWNKEMSLCKCSSALYPIDSFILPNLSSGLISENFPFFLRLGLVPPSPHFLAFNSFPFPVSNYRFIFANIECIFVSSLNWKLYEGQRYFVVQTCTARGQRQRKSAQYLLRMTEHMGE